MDRAVVKTVCTKLIDDVLSRRMLIVREQFRVSAECLIRLGQLRTSPVAGNRVYEGVPLVVGFEFFLDLGPEVMRVRLRSVEAVVRLRRHNRQHLSLPPRERRRAEHQGSVERHRRVHRPRVLAHDVDDVPDTAGALQGIVEELLQQAFRLADRDLLDIGHDRKLPGGLRTR